MSNPGNEEDKVLIITKRLVILLACSFGITTIFLGAFLLIDQFEKFYVSWLVLQCGIIGGFVSIQQRLNKMEDDELSLLSRSWYTVLLVPLYGGIFALILYILFLSGIVKNEIFPSFYYPDFDEVVTTQNIINFLNNCYPKSGPDLAKLIFWSFISGFSERFVPQLLRGITRRGSQSRQNT